MSRDCVVHAGDALNLDDTDAQSERFLTRCLTEPGARLRLTLPTETTMPDTIPTPDATETPAATPTPAAPAAAAPAHRAAPRELAPYHEIVTPPASEPTTIEAVAPAEPLAAPATELHATTQAAPESPNGVADLSQIQGLAAGNPVVTVILAVILVGGGTAGWKFWQKKSEQSHELSMKKIDMEIEMAGLNGAQPPPCQTASIKLNAELTEIRGDVRELGKSNGDAHKHLQEQIDALSDRIGKIEKKAASLLSGDLDPEELENRIAKIEKELKAAKAAETKAKNAEAKAKAKA